MNLGKPSIQNIGYTFLSALVMVETWAFIQLLHEVPALRARETAWDLIGIMAYVQGWALLESLIVGGVVAGIALLLLPARLAPKFVPLTTGFILVSAVWAMVVHYAGRPIPTWSTFQSLVWWGGYMLLAAAVFLAVIYSARFEGLMTAGAKRVAILAALYALIGLVSLIIVLVRNIL